MLSKKEERQVYMRVLGVLGFALVGIPLLFYFSPALELLYDTVEWIEQTAAQFPVLSMLVFMLLTSLAATVVFVGIFPLVPSALMLWGPEVTFALLMAGWMFGDVVLYFVGRGVGGDTISRTSFFSKVDALRERLKGKEFFLILLLRIALPTELFGYVLGVMKYSFVPYVLVTILAELPFAALTVYGADAFLKGNIFAILGAVILATVVITVAAFVAKRR
jgi:uncharacterized membrane protein YdjX (TVP38/TMEM64 family)